MCLKINYEKMIKILSLRVRTILSDVFIEKIWNMIYERYKVYEDFAIIDEETTLLTGILLYYEKEGTCVIELPEYLDEWTAPLLFTSYVKKKIYTIPRDISFCG